MVTVAVIGSRKFKDYDFLREKLDAIYNLIGRFDVVTGGADGADSLGIRWANEHGVIPTVFPADFYDTSHPFAVIKRDRKGRPYDALAGHRRNQQIIDAADIIVAFTPPEKPTPGTADAIQKARAACKPVYVFWRE